VPQVLFHPFWRMGVAVRVAYGTLVDGIGSR
jgi:hypothetical protein